MADWGISEERVQEASPEAYALGKNLQVRSIPAAHPKLRIDQDNQPHTVGYLFQHNNKTLYLAGDTSVCDELINELNQIGPIDVALLPVNEDNYFRRRRGIVGNIVSAKLLAWLLKSASKVVPSIGHVCEQYKPSGAVYNSDQWPFELLDSQDIAL